MTSLGISRRHLNSAILEICRNSLGNESIEKLTQESLQLDVKSLKQTHQDIVDLCGIVGVSTQPQNPNHPLCITAATSLLCTTSKHNPNSKIQISVICISNHNLDHENCFAKVMGVVVKGNSVSKTSFQNVVEFKILVSSLKNIPKVGEQIICEIISLKSYDGESLYFNPPFSSHLLRSLVYRDDLNRDSTSTIEPVKIINDQLSHEAYIECTDLWIKKCIDDENDFRLFLSQALNEKVNEREFYSLSKMNGDVLKNFSVEFAAHLIRYKTNSEFTDLQSDSLALGSCASSYNNGNNKSSQLKKQNNNNNEDDTELFEGFDIPENINLSQSLNNSRMSFTSGNQSKAVFDSVKMRWEKVGNDDDDGFDETAFN